MSRQAGTFWFCSHYASNDSILPGISFRSILRLSPWAPNHGLFFRACYLKYVKSLNINIKFSPATCPRREGSRWRREHRLLPLLSAPWLVCSPIYFFTFLCSFILGGRTRIVDASSWVKYLHTASAVPPFSAVLMSLSLPSPGWGTVPR